MPRCLLLCLPLCLGCVPKGLNAASPNLIAPPIEFDTRSPLEAVARGDGPAAERPDVRLALGEAWAQEAERRELDALGRHVAAYDACFDTPGCVPAFLEPDLGEARVAWRRAGARFRQALELDPDGARAADAAYGLAWSWRALGEDRLADAVLCWLLVRHPESAYRRDALLLRGEFDWSAYDHAPAPYDYATAWTHGIEMYASVAADREEPLRAFAQYREGWLWYSIGEYGRSIDTFKEAVDASSPRPGAAPVVPMEDEALQALVKVYADAGELDDSPCYGARTGRPVMEQMLARLADTYVEQGKWDQAIQTWRRLASADGADRLTWQAHIVELYVTLERPDEVVAETARLRAWAADATLSPEQDEALEHGLRESAFTLHRAARGHHPDLYTTTLALYAEHQARWPDVRNTPAIAWGRALALEESGQLDAAREAYAALLSAAPNGLYSRDCARALARLGGPSVP